MESEEKGFRHKSQNFPTTINHYLKKTLSFALEISMWLIHFFYFLLAFMSSSWLKIMKEILVDCDSLSDLVIMQPVLNYICTY